MSSYPLWKCCSNILIYNLTRIYVPSQNCLVLKSDPKYRYLCIVYSPKLRYFYLQSTVYINIISFYEIYVPYPFSQLFVLSSLLITEWTINSLEPLKIFLLLMYRNHLLFAYISFMKDIIYMPVNTRIYLYITDLQMLFF